MAKLSDQVQVKIADQGAEGGKRRFSVQVEASETLFYLPDALTREGVMKELRTELRSVIRDGVLHYIQQSRELIKKLGTGEKSKDSGKSK